MKIHLVRPTLLIAVLLSCISCTEKQNGRIDLKFDKDWKFHRGALSGAEKTDFDLSAWRDVDLPHDWSIEDIPGTGSPFDSASVGARGTGFAVGGTGWYAKTFVLDKSYKGKRVNILFEGVYMDSDIWINSFHLGNQPYGYTSFHFDITDYLYFDGRVNRLAVEVKNEGANCRWYSGSGIYRHVWLTATDPVHIKRWGTFATTLSSSSDQAEIQVETELANHRDGPADIKLVLEMVNSDGLVVASVSEDLSVKALEEKLSVQKIQVDNPGLWSPDSPELYSLRTLVKEGKKILDQSETSFGIRTVVFDPERGFLLNGKGIKLKGGCMHHDNGPLGAAAYDRAEERRVELMKASGFNAIRTSHNPPSPGFLDACDRLGMLVIDEIYDGWFQDSQKKPYYQIEFEQGWPADVRDFVLRDRNHPSVILWSTGNEIMDKMASRAIKAQEEITALFRKLDPSRAVSCGMNEWGHDDWDVVLESYMAPLDVTGYNYQESKYVEDHDRYPERLIVSSESFPKLAFQYWMQVLDHDFVIGDFVWTGFDYLGEASIGWHGFSEGYPWTVAYCGDIDICGFKRPQSYYREILWETGKKVALFVKNPEPTFQVPSHSKWDYPDVHPSWTWPGYEGELMEAVIYSNSERVCLSLNGREIGTSETNRDNEFTAIFKLPYEPGLLVATAYEGEQVVESFELTTAGEPSALRITADRQAIASDGQDLSYLTVEVVDKEGTRLPFAEELLEFNIEGPGEIVGVGSARPNSVESFQLLRRTTFEGRCIVIVKSTEEAGEISLSAFSGALEPATQRIAAR